MKKELSAGGIVARKKRNKWEVLLITDMHNKKTFPKGLVEKGESQLETALREVREETGISEVKDIVAFKPIHYIYSRKVLISKSVYYFLFQATGRGKVKPQRTEGISEVEWMPVSKAVKLIGYPQTNLPLLKQAEDILKSLSL